MRSSASSSKTVGMSDSGKKQPKQESALAERMHILLSLFDPVDDAAGEHDVFMAAGEAVADQDGVTGFFECHFERFIRLDGLADVIELEYVLRFNEFVVLFVCESDRQYAEVDQVLQVDPCEALDQHDFEAEVPWCK